jgi:hypothetical protein
MELHQLDLLYGCLKQVSHLEETSDFPEQFINAIGDSVHADVIAELSSLLLEQEATGAVECTVIPNAATSELAARLLTVTGHDGKEKTYFFRIRDAATASTLPILGVLLAIYAANPIAMVVPSATIAKNLYSNLLSLHHQQDNVALKVIGAITAIRARRASPFQRLFVEDEFPTTEEISSYLPDLTFEKIRVALTRLDSLGLIECKHWGDQAKDVSHRDNRWGEKL